MNKPTISFVLALLLFLPISTNNVMAKNDNGGHGSDSHQEGHKADNKNQQDNNQSVSTSDNQYSKATPDNPTPDPQASTQDTSTTETSSTSSSNSYSSNMSNQSTPTPEPTSTPKPLQQTKSTTSNNSASGDSSRQTVDNNSNSQTPTATVAPSQPKETSQPILQAAPLPTPTPTTQSKPIPVSSFAQINNAPKKAVETLNQVVKAPQGLIADLTNNNFYQSNKIPPEQTNILLGLASILSGSGALALKPGFLLEALDRLKDFGKLLGLAGRTSYR